MVANLARTAKLVRVDGQSSKSNQFTQWRLFLQTRSIDRERSKSAAARAARIAAHDEHPFRLPRQKPCTPRYLML